MFFIAGTSTTKRRRGYTLLLCPICRSARAFSVFDICEQAHLYFIPLSSPKYLGTLLICHDCGARLAPKSSLPLSIHHCADPSTLWELLSPSTSQQLFEEMKEELELLSDPRTAALPQRQKALKRAFLACETELASKLKGGQHHSPLSFLSVLAGSVCGVLGGGALVVGLSDFPKLGGQILLMLVGGLLLLAAATLLYYGSASYLVKHKLLPRLLRSLAPLSPTIDELNEVLLGLREQRSRIARRIILAGGAESLRRHLEDYQEEAGTRMKAEG